MAVSPNFLSVGMDTVPSYFIYRDVVPGAPFDPTSPPKFFPAKDSDELFDALRVKYPHVPNHADRMRDAIIDFLLEERAAESFQTSPALTVDPSTVSWTSASSGTMSSFFNSPENFAMPTPASLNQSPLPEAHIGDHSVYTPGPVDRSPKSLDAMTGVFSVSTGAQPKQRTRRKMTEAEKVDYRNRRIAKACDKCAKRKRKCQHGENAKASGAASAPICHKIVKSPRVGAKQAVMPASIRDISSAFSDHTSHFRLEDIGSADLFDFSMLGDLDLKPEDFMFDAFVHDSNNFANFGDQNFQALTNSASFTLQDSAPRRPRAPSIMVEDFELYSPPRDSEDGWATATNPTTLNFGQLCDGQQSAALIPHSHTLQQNLGEAAQSNPTLLSTNVAMRADATALFDANQSQTALAQLTRARGCPRLGNNSLRSAPILDNPVVVMSNDHQQTIAPNIPHDSEGHGAFATDQNANCRSIFATCNAHGTTMTSDVSRRHPDSTMDSNRTNHQLATQASNAMLASTMFADNGQGPLGFQNAASRPLPIMAGRLTHADLQQHVVRDLSSQILAGQNIGADVIIEPESRHSHAPATGKLTGMDTAADILTPSYGFAPQMSYLQLGGCGVSHAGLSLRAASTHAILAASTHATRAASLAIQEPLTSGNRNQPDDGHWSAADLGNSQYDLTDQCAPANDGKSPIDNNVAGTQPPARSQPVKDECSIPALLSPQGVSLASCLIVTIALLLTAFGVDRFLISLLMLASLVPHGRGWDDLFTQQDGLSLVDNKSSTTAHLSHSPLWAVSSVYRSRIATTFQSLRKATSAQMLLPACTTARLRIESMT